jgi:hypothetical protein
MTDAQAEIMQFRAAAIDQQWQLKEWHERAQYLMQSGVGTDAHADGVALAALLAQVKAQRMELTRLGNRLIVAQSFAKRVEQEFDAFDNLCEERDRWRAMYYSANDARLAAEAGESVSS